MAITDVVEHELVVAGTSIAADFNSAFFEVSYHDNGSIHAIWTGADAVDGTVIPQASLNAIDWCDLVPTTAVQKVDAASGCLMYNFTDIGYKYWRIKFTANSNTAGTMQVLTMLKRRGRGGL